MYGTAYLVCGEAVVQLNDTNLVSACTRLEPSIGEDFVHTILAHGEPHHVHGASALERGRVVSEQRLGDKFNCLVLQVVRVHEVF